VIVLDNRYTKVQSEILRAVFAAKTETPVAVEKAKLGLIKRKIVSSLCFTCNHFVGNYTGKYKFLNGCYIPKTPHKQCFGKQGNNPCLYFEEIKKKEGG